MKKIILISLILLLSITTTYATCDTVSNYKKTDTTISNGLIQTLINIGDKIVTKNPNKIDTYVNVLTRIGEKSTLKPSQREIIGVLKEYFGCKKGREEEVAITCDTSIARSYVSSWNRKFDKGVNKSKTVCDNEDCSYFHSILVEGPERGKSLYDMNGKYIDYIKGIVNDTSSIFNSHSILRLGGPKINLTQDVFDRSGGGFNTSNGWFSTKIYIPGGIGNANLSFSGYPSLGLYIGTATFIPDGYNKEVELNRNLINEYSETYKKEKIGKTYKFGGESYVSIKLPTNHNGGWLYIDMAGNGSSVITRAKDIDSDIALGFVGTDINKTKFINWLNSVKLDSKGEPLDNNCVKIKKLINKGKSYTHAVDPSTVVPVRENPDCHPGSNGGPYRCD